MYVSLHISLFTMSNYISVSLRNTYFSIFLYLSVSCSIFLYPSPSVSVSLYPFPLYIDRSSFLSICLYVCMFVCLYLLIYQSIYIFNCLPFYLSPCVCVCAY